MTWIYKLDWQGHPLTLSRDESEAEPQTGSSLPPAPGAGVITFPAMFLYSNGESAHLEAEITGNKIARVYLDVYFEGEDGWLAGPVCQRELTAPQNRKIGGVNLPMWKENNKLSAIWQPAMPLLLSGNDAACAFTQPSQSNPDEIWVHAMRISGENDQRVRLQFSTDGTFQRVTAVNSASRGLRLQPGDQLIPEVNWLRRESGRWHTASGSSNAITITDQSLRRKEVPAPPGRYHVGLLVRDLDGQPHRRSITFENPAAVLTDG